MKYSNNPAANDWVREMVRLGCRFESGGKHGKLYAPDGRFLAVISYGSQDTGPGLRNARKRMLAAIGRAA